MQVSLWFPPDKVTHLASLWVTHDNEHLSIPMTWHNQTCLWNTDALGGNKVKISKSQILTPPHPQWHVMSVKCEQSWDELTVQGWFLYDHPNFKYCTLFASGPSRRGGGGGGEIKTYLFHCFFYEIFPICQIKFWISGIYLVKINIPGFQQK